MIPTEHWTAIEARKKRDAIIRNEVLDTDSVLAVLKKRYRNEMAILDYIEMIECEVMALRQKAGE